jgi:RimJ/RimL family protein N-acetyltransferase
MPDKSAMLYSVTHPDLRLRMISQTDIENLRAWKNANKKSFFLNQDITPEQQAKWYESFCGREHDIMFVVEQQAEGKWTGIGCMGFRKLDEEACVDGYNIIRAKKIEPASFTMSEAFHMMLAYAVSLYPDLPIRVKVLSHNPAVAWYEKNDFSLIGKQHNYHLLELNKEVLKSISWTVK